MTWGRLLRTAAIALLATAALGYLGVIAYYKRNEARLVFPRTVVHGGYPAPPDSLRLPYRTVFFRTADSLRLAAWAVPASAPSGMWVLVCHGQSGNIATSTRPRFYADLRTLGVHVLAFDWRGYGASEGTPSEDGLYRDAMAAYEHLRRDLRVPAESIVIYGHSLGVVPAVDLATRAPAAGLVIEGGPSSVVARARELYPFLPVRLMLSNRFDAAERIGGVTMPILLLHSRDDRRIPFHHAEALLAATRAPARLVPLAGRHHDAFRVDSARYFAEFARFVAERRRPPPPPPPHRTP